MPLQEHLLVFAGVGEALLGVQVMLAPGDVKKKKDYRTGQWKVDRSLKNYKRSRKAPERIQIHCLLNILSDTMLSSCRF